MVKDQERWLVHIPVLGYFFRKIKENQEAIEKTLKTGKETKGKTKKGSLLFGLFRTTSDRIFNTLKLRKI